MSPKKKTFDCIEMKNAIQARLLEERERLGERAVTQRHHEWLETSDDPLARWWRMKPRQPQPANEA